MSDHCQIVTLFEIDKQNKDNSQRKNDSFKLQKSFKFEKTNKNIFLQELGSSKIQTKITSFLQQSYTLTEKGMQEANKNFSEIILQAAKYSLKTVSRKKTKRSMNIKKRCFNKECNVARKLMRNMSNIKHRNPNDQSIRDAYY